VYKKNEGYKLQVAWITPKFGDHYLRDASMAIFLKRIYPFSTAPLKKVLQISGITVSHETCNLQHETHNLQSQYYIMAGG